MHYPLIRFFKQTPLLNPLTIILKEKNKNKRELPRLVDTHTSIRFLLVVNFYGKLLSNSK